MDKYRFLVGLSAALLCCANVQGAVLSLSPLSQNINLGSIFTIDVGVSSLGSAIAPSVGVFDFDLGFDSNRLMFQSASFGSGLDVLGLGSIQSATQHAGSVNLFELSLDSIDDLNSLQPGAFVLAKVTFLAVALGDASLTLTINALGDAAGDSLTVTLGDSAKVTVLGAVPEPATYALFALGIAGIVLTGQQRRRA